MAREIEAFEEDARAVASQIRSVGEGLQAWNPAPEVVWGDDKFGDSMRASYYETLDGEGVSLPTAAMMMRNSIGGGLTQLGESLDGAITELVEQEQENHADISRVVPPNI